MNWRCCCCVQVLELSRRVQGTPYQQQLQIIHGDFMKVSQPAAAAAAVEL
jgi:hypothetical protein